VPVPNVFGAGFAMYWEPSKVERVVFNALEARLCRLIFIQRLREKSVHLVRTEH